MLHNIMAKKAHPVNASAFVVSRPSFTMFDRNTFCIEFSRPMLSSLEPKTNQSQMNLVELLTAAGLHIV